MRMATQWVKSVTMMEHHYALVEVTADHTVLVRFLDGPGREFDRMEFDGSEEADAALRRNDFDPWRTEMQSWRGNFPTPPYTAPLLGPRPIYSSGEKCRIAANRNPKASPVTRETPKVS